MIRITIDLVPFGNEEKKKTLSKIEIGNIGGDENNFDLYNYSYSGYLEGFSQDETDKVLLQKSHFSGNIKHLRSKNVLCLLSAVLKNILS